MSGVVNLKKIYGVDGGRVQFVVFPKDKGEGNLFTPSEAPWYIMLWDRLSEHSL